MGKNIVIIGLVINTIALIFNFCFGFYGFAVFNAIWALIGVWLLGQINDKT